MLERTRIKFLMGSVLSGGLQGKMKNALRAKGFEASDLCSPLVDMVCHEKEGVSMPLRLSV